MCRKGVEKIKVYLEERLGETKGLYDWCSELNQVLGKSRAVTPRELAHVFNRVLKDKIFIIEHRRDSTLYTFSPLSSESLLS